MSIASLLATLGHWAPLLLLVVPLMLGGLLAVPRLNRFVGALAPWAALPALLAGLTAPQTELLLPELLLGSSLMLDPVGRPFLVLLALLWLFAGWLAGDRLCRRGPALLFLLAMGGSFGLAVAGNLVVFLLASTVSGYALYGLAARQPGARAFVMVLVLGDLLVFELLLLLMKSGVGLSLAPAAAPTTAIGENLDLLLLTVLGFGAKAALFGLHGWLPRMLSGAAVELSPIVVGFVLSAGLLPWLRLLSPGTLAAADSNLLGWFGLASLGLAVMLGLLQGGRRALLGYALSALSGLWLVLLSLAGGEAGVLLPAPETEVRSQALALALGQAGLALVALLVQGTRHWSGQRWLDWTLNGVALFLFSDALLGMAGVLSFDSEYGLLIVACGLFGWLIGQLLWMRERDSETLLALGSGRTLMLISVALGWTLLMTAGQTIMRLVMPLTPLATQLTPQLASPLSAPVSAPLAALALIVTVAASALFASWLARLPRVPPGDLLILAARLPKRFQ